MKSKIEMDEVNKEKMLAIALAKPLFSDIRPKRFVSKMKTNQGVMGMLSKYGLGEDGLERKNPVIVAFGDSVTAGHFELFTELLPDRDKFEGLCGEDYCYTAQDLEDVYHERFRQKLHDKYKMTSVSCINSGIAGDDVESMKKRMYRDVIRYKPDLVIINATLNWNINKGTVQDYEYNLKEIVQAIKSNTDADIILMTPNMALPTEKDINLQERVEVVRKIGISENVSIADVYTIWEEVVNSGSKLEELLSNGINHPTIFGHEIMAIELMKLFEEE
ncbi:SGNH/GDSL hydrolase family protein [Clostridium saccharoperbutylacetonicum]|uniref:SGNH/GDSL hydrolase family protein n=1 Tax=Clostridium saccharoperbutylacetonicum TaxID=36745 RepID=UPI0039E8D55C